MHNKTKIILVSILILFIIGIAYLAIEFLFPREAAISGIYGAKEDDFKVETLQKNNQYYISLYSEPNKKIEIKCTKKQYDFFIIGRQYNIVYRVNFFNRNKGKILELSNVHMYLK